MSYASSFDRQRLLELLEQTDGYGMTPAQLIHAMEIAPGARRAFRAWLKAQQRQGVLSKGEAQRLRARRRKVLRGRLRSRRGASPSSTDAGATLPLWRPGRLRGSSTATRSRPSSSPAAKAPKG